MHSRLIIITLPDNDNANDNDDNNSNIFFKRNKKLEAKDVSPNINHTQRTARAKKRLFVPGDLNLQTRLSERPNTSSV